MRKVKIVCTLGPSTASTEVLTAMIRAGMDVARFNFSHGDHDGHSKMLGMLREAAGIVGKPVAALCDLCGPKIRLRRVAGGRAELVAGQRVVLSSSDQPGTAGYLTHSYLSMARDVRPGQSVLIDDGLVHLEVEQVTGDDVECVVRAGGVVSDRKGINLPQTQVSAPALTAKDREDLAFAVEMGFDFVALSFVRFAADVREAKALAQGIPVIAKIEKPEAIHELEAILDAADGAMIARGDLGVEIGHERVPILQKSIITRTRPKAKPVITATQMLESMMNNSTPTRAEVSDVANAVLDGSDALMLSGETAVGRHPVKVVETMARIVREVEESGFKNLNLSNPVMKDRSFSSAIAEAVTSATDEFDIKAIAVYSESGHSAALVAAERPAAAIIAFTRHDSILRRLALHWGVQPLHGDWVVGVEGVVAQAERALVERELVKAGDSIAVTFGMRLGNESFQTNMLKLWRVREDMSIPLNAVRGYPASLAKE